MANWSNPTVTTDFDDALDDLKNRDVDALTMQVSAATNPPTGALRWVRATDKWQEWDGAAYVDQILSVAGGGTGGATAADARTNLGLGTMATQDSSAVNISGGTLAGSGSGITALNGSNVASGTIAAARLGASPTSAKVLFGDNTWAVISTQDFTLAAEQSAGFTAAVGNAYPLNGTFTVVLPTVVGNGGKKICLMNFGTGVITIDPDGSETIMGSATFSFNWGQYSSITLLADANNGRWGIV